MALTLTPIQQDTLKEIANIGANAASEALSRMTSKSIGVRVHTIQVVPLSHVHKIQRGGHSQVGVLFTINCDLDGVIASVASPTDCLAIRNLVRGQLKESSINFDMQTKDLIKEVENILVGHYLAALSNLSKLNMIESIPHYCEGSVSNIVGQAVKMYEKKVEDLVLIETYLQVEKKRFRQDLILMLNSRALNLLLKSLFDGVSDSTKKTRASPKHGWGHLNKKTLASTK